jgi:hypothetical protein
MSDEELNMHIEDFTTNINHEKHLKRKKIPTQNMVNQ